MTSEEMIDAAVRRVCAQKNIDREGIEYLISRSAIDSAFPNGWRAIGEIRREFRRLAN